MAQHVQDRVGGTTQSPLATMACSTAAKAGVLGLTRHTASEVARDGKTVNTAWPGNRHRHDPDHDHRSLWRSLTPIFCPIPRLRPQMRWRTWSRSCRPIGAYITGASLDINGGVLMI